MGNEIRLGQWIVFIKRFVYDRNMDAEPSMASIGAMIGAPARANILAALFDGRALTATELCQGASVSPATGSEHLAKLVEAGLLKCEQHGRHRYFRLASPQVAEALEPLVHLVAAKPVPIRVPSKSAQRLRRARLCYDHFAGELGVAIAASMLDRGLLSPQDKDFQLTTSGEAFCATIGIDLAKTRSMRRHFARQCLDWSERRPHLAGALGAAFADLAFAKGWVERTDQRREVSVTQAGLVEFKTEFGIDLALE